METSAFGVSVSVSVAELFPGEGSVIPPAVVAVAVLLSEPVARLEMGQLAVYVTLPPAGRLTESLRLPAPAAVQVPPPAPTHVQVQVSEAGKVPAPVLPAAALGPALLAVMV